MFSLKRVSWSWCLFTTIETLTRAEVGTRHGSIAVIGWTMVLFKGNWTLGVWVGKAVECYNHCLMGQTSRTMEESGAECSGTMGA